MRRILLCAVAGLGLLSPANGGEPAPVKVQISGGTTTVPWTDELTLVRTIMMHGGMPKFGEGIVIVKRNGTQLRFDVKKIFKEGGGDPKLLPGDEISFPQAVIHMTN